MATDPNISTTYGTDEGSEYRSSDTSSNEGEKRFSNDEIEQSEINRDIMRRNSEKGNYAAKGGLPDGRIVVKGEPLNSEVEPESEEEHKERVNRAVEDRARVFGVMPDIEEEDGDFDEEPRVTPASAVPTRTGRVAHSKRNAEVHKRTQRLIPVRFVRGYYPAEGEKIARGAEMDLPISDARHLIESGIAVRIDEL